MEKNNFDSNSNIFGFGATSKFGKPVEERKLEVGHIYGGSTEIPGEPLDNSEQKTTGFGTTSRFGTTGFSNPSDNSEQKTTGFGTTSRFGKQEEERRLEVGHIYGGSIEDPGEPLEETGRTFRR